MQIPRTQPPPNHIHLQSQYTTALPCRDHKPYLAPRCHTITTQSPHTIKHCRNVANKILICHTHSISLHLAPALPPSRTRTIPQPHHPSPAPSLTRTIRHPHYPAPAPSRTRTIPHPHHPAPTPSRTRTIPHPPSCTHTHTIPAPMPCAPILVSYLSQGACAADCLAAEPVLPRCEGGGEREEGREGSNGQGCSSWL